MTLSIICTHKNPEPWVAALKAVDASLDIQIWPDENDKGEVEFAICWRHPEVRLRQYPNLKCICSMGAGVDHLLSDPFLPKNVPVVRLIDPNLAQSMFEYVCAAVMYYFRDFNSFQAQQRQSYWQQLEPKPIGQTTLGIMGMGQLGAYCATRFSNMGFNVVGWSRSEKQLKGIVAYAGPDQLKPFLAASGTLICLLPLTNQTRGILNLDLFNQLPKGAYLINVARGEHLLEEDLMTALNEGQLQGACLDVFQEEPLPAAHPFWSHPKILVTPHCSSLTDPRSVAPQIVQNYRLMRAGKPLINQVDVLQGY